MELDSKSDIRRVTSPIQGMAKISRTSCWHEEKPPCDGAVRFEVMSVDRRRVDDPKKIPANKGTDGGWYTRGENHRIEDGCICRDLGWREEWFIEVDDVFGFAEKHGRCIVSVDEDGWKCIEIYDDYRE